jgi:transposase
MHAAEQFRPDVAEQRAHWHERLATEPTGRLVFVDESGANTQMARLAGRSPVGERFLTHVPFGHYETSTLIAAVRLDGARAPWVFTGAMDGEMFLAWIRQGLVPTLQPEDLVIMDNLATHKVAGVREAIESAGARLCYLPPYSPDFNPIENMWSKIKQSLRSLAPRTGEELLRAAAFAFAAVSKADCLGFFLHAQYAI